MRIEYLFELGYYRYLIYRLKRSEFFDRLLIDPLIVGIFLAFVTASAFVFIPGKVDIHVPELGVQVGIIDTLVRVQSIFFGILFSFLVLSFNVFAKYFGRYAFQMFFRLRSIRRLYTLLVLNLVFLVYVAGYMRDVKAANPYSDLLYVYSLVSSSLTIALIVPSVISLLQQSQSRAHIKELIRKLNMDWVISFHENTDWSDHREKHYEKDPITLLTEIGTSSLKDFDFTTFRMVVNGCLEYFDEILESKATEIPPINLYYEFSRMFLNLYQIAAKERNENAMMLLIDARGRLERSTIGNLHRVALKDYHGKYMGYKFKFEIKDYFNRAAQFNEDAVCQQVIDEYRDFGKQLIEKVLPGKFDYNPDDRIKSMDEQAIMQGYITELDYLMSVLVQTKKFHLFANFSNLYYTLDSVTSSSDNTHESKRFILHVLDYSKYENFEKFLKNSGLTTLRSLEYPWYLSANTVLRQAQISIPLHGMLRSLNLLLASGVLSNNTINCLKTDAFHLIAELEKQPKYKNLLLLCIRKFAELRNFIGESDNDYRKEVYVKLFRYAGYVDSNIKLHKITDEQILKEMANTLAGFVHAEKFEKELSDKGHIIDDRIA